MNQLGLSKDESIYFISIQFRLSLNIYILGQDNDISQDTTETPMVSLDVDLWFPIYIQWYSDTLINEYKCFIKSTAKVWVKRRLTMILNIHSTTKGLLKQTFSVRVASQTHTTASTLASQTAQWWKPQASPHIYISYGVEYLK